MEACWYYHWENSTPCSPEWGPAFLAFLLPHFFFFIRWSFLNVFFSHFFTWYMNDLHFIKGTEGGYALPCAVLVKWLWLSWSKSLTSYADDKHGSSCQVRNSSNPTRTSGPRGQSDIWGIRVPKPPSDASSKRCVAVGVGCGFWSPMAHGPFGVRFPMMHFLTEGSKSLS